MNQELMKKKMKKIIINADDFGINELVTSEIERHLLAGNVSSTTVMANGSCLEEVKRFAGQHPEFSYGVHLCLSEFESITKSEDLRHAGLVGEDGKFIHNAIFHSDKLKNRDVQDAIKAELNAQIDVVTSLGFPVSHADSHHHVHTIFQLKEVFAEVLKDRGIKKIRLEADFRNWRSKRHLILWTRQVLLNKYYRSLFAAADAFYSYKEFLNTGQTSNTNVVELMCHPGHPSMPYKNEMKLVETKEVLKRNDIKLITYNDLY